MSSTVYDFRDQTPAWTQYAINTSGSHDKYYETRIDLADDGWFVLTKRWGRRPDTGKGQQKTEIYQSMSTAMGVAHGQLEDKIRGGYYLVDRPDTADSQVVTEDWGDDEDY
jgi:predicted DNA-binding WGR domain protein